MDQILGDVIELSIVVRDLEAAVDRDARLFGLKVHRRTESQEFGFKNAILPLGRGHIELLQPTDPSKPWPAISSAMAKGCTSSVSRPARSRRPSSTCVARVPKSTFAAPAWPGCIPGERTA